MTDRRLAPIPNRLLSNMPVNNNNHNHNDVHNNDKKVIIYRRSS